MSKFVHLHTHSHYSLLDGLGKIPELVSRAKELGMGAMAITDHGAMYGVIEFYKKCQESGIKPIIGVETYVAPRRMFDKQPKIDANPYHLILLAKNEQGYKNLLYLVTKSYLEGHYYKPRIDKELLKDHAEGLIASTACLMGEIPRAILNASWEKVIEVAKTYLEIFGKENFYLELQDHPEVQEQVKVNAGLKKLAKELKIPLIATCDIHYIKEEDREPHEVLLAVQTGKDYDDESRMTLKEVNLSVRPPEEMEKIFGEEICQNTVEIAQKCNLEFEFGKPIFPHFELPKNQTSKSYLEKLSWEGLTKRYLEITPALKERLRYELDTIEKTHFEDYLLIVADYVKFAKDSRILVGPGRGSAAGSLVCYSLGITDIDPIKYNLLFERFLNPERIAPPDIDLDFADARRDEVIKYIANKYGSNNVAQIITFGTMASRGSVRDTGRALGMAYSDVDKIAKLIPFGLTLDQSFEAVDELKDLYSQDEQVKKLLDMARRLEGVARHASTHAAGVVISREPLMNYVPLQYSTRGDEEVITQYPMNDLEAIGLIKMDILGLANLTIMGNCLRIVRKTHSQEIDIDNLPLDDEKTFNLLARAQTVGVFQLESDGMRRYLKELKPTEFSDIIAMVALYRPGPMEYIPDYISGKHGRKEIHYLHPKLKDILAETYGIAVYQEQLLQIARQIAGFSLGEADILRKAVGKKIKKLLMEQQVKFVAGATKNGVSNAVAEKLFHFIEPFAQYGFNKAHATCYAKIAYQTAYLKANFPQEYMAALLTSEHNNLDKLSIAISECERMGIKVLAPDINESFVEFGVVKASGNIRFGLAAIKNVGLGVSEAIVEERKINGPFKSFEEFLQRLGSSVLNKKVIESLAKAGGFDLFADRSEILSGIDLVIKFLSDLNKNNAQKGAGQTDLFANISFKPQMAKLTLPKVEPISKKQKLAWEKELLGMYISEHPLKDFADLIREQGTPIAQISETNKEKKVKVAGIVSSIKKIITKSNEPMAFVLLEDETAKIEVIVFPKVLKNNTLLFQVDNIIIVSGRLNNKDGVLKVIAEEARPLDGKKASQVLKKPLRFFLELSGKIDKEKLLQIKSILEEFPGSLRVILKVNQPSGEKEIKTKTQVENNPKLNQRLKELLPKAKIILK